MSFILLTSFDQWIINKAVFPGTFGIVVGLAIGTVFIPEIWIFIRQHLLIIERKGQSAAFLPPMTIHQIAEYLQNESVWAYKLWCKVNLRESVTFAVSDEMARAGMEGKVRFLGTRPNDSLQLEEISRNYWITMTIDRDRIWDNRNTTFTTSRNGNGIFRYQNGTAPRVDVERTWPKASIFRKVFSICYMWGKLKWVMSIKPFFKKAFLPASPTTKTEESL